MRPAYSKGVEDVGGGCFAYLQPDGSWGLSNAGLVVHGNRSLLVDTLFDIPLTREMLEAFRRTSPIATAPIDYLVNTHSNGDHCWGNELVEEADVIASASCAEEMAAVDPKALAGVVAQGPTLGRVGAFMARIFARFAFDTISHIRLPTQTFAGELALMVGDLEVRLIEVGPAHTRGDVMIHVPAARVLYAGDILIVGGHPIMWAGPVGSYLAALDRILALDVDAIVPGHGPVLTDVAPARKIKAYLEHLRRETRTRYDAGMSVLEAARDIRLDDYADWGEPERIVVNITTLYREFSGGTPQPNNAELFAQMAELT
jgi:glyoxylase-like metal-dependent hydrolase (beta-lactamase superfamily II)